MSKSPGECGCNEYQHASRRDFMRVSGSLAIAAAMPAWLPRVAFANSHAGDRDVVVSIFLRGGVDSLSMCVPFNESYYYDKRPTLAVPPPDSPNSNRAVALDDNFGFSQPMTPLMDAFESGDLLIVHACGLENPTRSHFEAMHFMEVGQGTPPATLFSGWLGRHLQATAPTLQSGVLRGVGIGYGLQRTLIGGEKTLPIDDLAYFGLDGPSAPQRREAIEAMFEPFSDPLKTATQNTSRTIDLLKSIDFDGYKPQGGAKYPESDFGYAMKSTAALVKADIGVEAIAIDLEGWDTHEQQGNVGGWMERLMRDLSHTVAAFHKDLWASKRSDVAVMCMTEFGRNAFENGSRGTDHGHGSLMLALGGSIAGGRVLTEWPGLDRAQLYDGQDLQITIDYRDIVAEVLTKRAGNPDAKSIFPDAGYRPKDHGAVA